MHGAHLALKISNVPLDSNDAAAKSALDELALHRRSAVREHPLIISYFGRRDVGGYLITSWELGGCTLEHLLEREITRGRTGMSMEDLLRDDAYPPGYMLQIASAIDFLNQNGIEHHDIKPANVVLFAGRYAKLADLGLARFTGPASGGGSVSRIGGTPGYMPPEIWANKVHRTWDLYSAAVTYFQLRTGREAFGGDPNEVYRRQQENDLDTVGLERLESYEVEALRQALDPVPEHRPPGGVWRFFKSICPQQSQRQAFTAEPPPATELEFERHLAYVPAGDIQMGSPTNEHGRSPLEQPHEIRITRPFDVAVYPVTVGQFREFVEATRYRTEAERDGGGSIWKGMEYVNKSKAAWKKPGFKQTADDPVVLVSWADCQAFCRWLSEASGKEFRLLTEAEWEFVCRGGAQSYEVFGVGNGKSLSSEDANFDGTQPYGVGGAKPSPGHTSPVGSHKPNHWGIHDMHGNIWEWCQDYYADRYYELSPAGDPQGPDSGSLRVLRGGGWNSPGKDCRSACRSSADPSFRANDIGFRVMRVLG